jgi:hypothetical protein
VDGGSRTRLPKKAHTSRPWRIHEIVPDFELEDVWALPTPGGPGDFPRLVRQMSSFGPSFSGAARALWELREKVGGLLGWDRPDAGLGSGVPTLRDRLPADLRDGPSGPDFDALPATPLYLTDDEFAAEGANRTVHGVMHLGWVPDGTGGYRGADGRLGEAERAVRGRLHGRDQAVPVPDRLPGAHADDRTGVAGGCRRSDGVGRPEMKVSRIGDRR